MELSFSPPVGVVTVANIEDYRTRARAENPETVFPQSVASGDPSPRGAILWTRIAPSAYKEGTPLILEVAEDENFMANCRQRVVNAQMIGPEHDYTIKVDLDESDLDLDANQQYYYRFEYDGVKSQTGRCKTLPSSNATLESIRFAVVTCQNYTNGCFGAWHHIAEEEVDFLIDLGDFIYETTEQSEHSREYPDHDIEMLPSGCDIALGLEDYRHIYRTYHSKQFLQEALEQHTRIHVWDDHEFVNDIYWDYAEDAPRASDHPYDEYPECMRRLMRDALQAWWEYTPARVEYNPKATHVNEVLTLYRSFQFGDLLTLIVTDERLYRTKPPSNWVKNRLRIWMRNRLSDGLSSRFFSDLGPTMLGEAQRDWFIQELQEEQPTWTVWANEVLTLPLHIPKFNHGAWDGYYDERRQIMHTINQSLQSEEQDSQKGRSIRNFVTLTGDMHSYLAGYQRVTFSPRDQIVDLLRQITNSKPSPPPNRRVGVELMTPAITSVNITEKSAEWIAERLRVDEDWVANYLGSVLRSKVPALLRHILFFDGHEWGYSVVEFTPNDCTHRAYSVDKTVNSSDAKKRLIQAIKVPNGRIEINKVCTM